MHAEVNFKHQMKLSIEDMKKFFKTQKTSFGSKTSITSETPMIPVLSVFASI